MNICAAGERERAYRGCQAGYLPISYLKTNTADVARQLAEETDSLIITQNGVPAFVCVSMDKYHQTKETNALLRILALGEREINVLRWAKTDIEDKIKYVRKKWGTLLYKRIIQFIPIP